MSNMDVINVINNDQNGTRKAKNVKLMNDAYFFLFDQTLTLDTIDRIGEYRFFTSQYNTNEIHVPM